MKTIRLARTLNAFLLGTALSVAPVFAQTSAPQTEPAKKVKMTDSKLSAINYGIESLEYWVSKMTAGDTRRGDALLRDHAKLVTRFGRIKTSTDEQYIYVSNSLKKLKQAIEKKSGKPTTTATTKTSSATTKTPEMPRNLVSIQSRLKSLEKDAENMRPDHPKLTARVQSDLASLQTSFARVPKSTHAAYTEVVARIKAIETRLTPEGGPLNMTAAEVTAYVNGIQKKYTEEVTLPEARGMLMNRELTAAAVDTFVGKIKTFSEHADKDLPQLRRVVQATGEGAYWAEWLETKALESLKREMSSLKASIDSEVNFGLSNAKSRSELDVEKNNYAFQNERMRENNEELFSRTLRTIDQASRLEKLLSLPATWSPKKAEMEGYVKLYQQKVAAASQARGLPVEVGTKDQHKIAKEVFSKRKYGVGERVRTIVNSKTVPRDRIEHKEFAGKLETVVRRWEEFQVTTVEKEKGKYFVYINNLAKFSRAPNPTPIGSWLLKQRFKKGEISADKLK